MSARFGITAAIVSAVGLSGCSGFGSNEGQHELSMRDIGSSECVEVTLRDDAWRSLYDVLWVDRDSNIVTAPASLVDSMEVIAMNNSSAVARDTWNKQCLDRNEVSRRNAVKSVNAGENCYLINGGIARLDGDPYLMTDANQRCMTAEDLAVEDAVVQDVLSHVAAADFESSETESKVESAASHFCSYRGLWAGLRLASSDHAVVNGYLAQFTDPHAALDFQTTVEILCGGAWTVNIDPPRDSRPYEEYAG